MTSRQTATVLSGIAFINDHECMLAKSWSHNHAQDVRHSCMIQLSVISLKRARWQPSCVKKFQTKQKTSNLVDLSHYFSFVPGLLAKRHVPFCKLLTRRQIATGLSDLGASCPSSDAEVRPSQIAKKVWQSYCFKIRCRFNSRAVLRPIAREV